MPERQQQSPSHRAYTVSKREGESDLWLEIGLAFTHLDGNGLDVRLKAFPLDGEIVLRRYFAREENG